MPSPDSLFAFCTAYKQGTFRGYDQSLLFRQKHGVNRVVRRVYLAITAKLASTEQTCCTWWITGVDHVASTYS